METVLWHENENMTEADFQSLENELQGLTAYRSLQTSYDLIIHQRATGIQILRKLYCKWPFALFDGCEGSLRCL